MNEIASKRKRKIYFIEKEFQTKFIVRFCGIVLMAGVLTIAALYLLAMKSTTVSFVNSRAVVQTTADFMLPIFIQTVIIVTVIISLVTISFTLLVSHKIAGPLYRFKKVLETLGDGDFSSDFKIRQMDQLQDVADTFNKAIGKTRGQLNSLKSTSLSFKKKLGDILKEGKPENDKAALTELKRMSDELDRIIQYFKS